MFAINSTNRTERSHKNYVETHKDNQLQIQWRIYNSLFFRDMSATLPPYYEGGVDLFTEGSET